jgi:tetratricopeptide (TPR) repeat protein
MSCDLELEITSGPTPGVYIIAVDSPAGAASGQLRLDVERLLNRRRELASAVLASAVPTRGRLSAQELPIREVGMQLFEAVFAERVYGRYTASMQEAVRQGEPLRVVLRLRAPELAALPWEAMFDPEADEYLCQREPIIRYVETAQPATPLPVNPPLRILGLISAPSDLPALDVAEERRRLTDAIDDLAKRRQVQLTWASGGTWPTLQEMLLDGHWHVLHFIGHGGIDRGEGVLALEDELTGRANLVSSARFARLLHACRPVPRLVVLNSCQSGEAGADDLLSSTAAALVHSGISAAVAMQFVVTDPAALAFSRGFYQSLAHNHPVDEAVRLGRIAIDGTSENTLEWVTPVLFLRTDETRLFTVVMPDDGDAPSRSKEPSPEQMARESTLNGLYMQALAAMRTDRYADAITLLDSLLALEPNYRDAADRRDAARRNQRSAAGYERGRAAEAAGNWDSAVAEYTAITDIEPDYRDVSKRLADCTKRQQAASLLEELRMHCRAGEWQAVIAVGDELTALGLKSAEVDKATKTARQQIRRARGGPRRARTARAAGRARTCSRRHWRPAPSGPGDRTCRRRDTARRGPLHRRRVADVLCRALSDTRVDHDRRAPAGLGGNDFASHHIQ